MEDSSKVEMWAWGCGTIMFSVLISCITYYNVTISSAADIANQYKEKKLEFYESMVIEHGVSPAVLECIDRNWNESSVYIICEKVLASNDLSKEDAAEMVRKLKEN